MSFEAKYPGRCGECDERIHTGDLVQYVDELVHTVCEVTSLPNRRDDTREVCRQCWMVHAGDCL